MHITIRRIVALQALVLTAAAAPSGVGQSSTMGDPSALVPVGEFGSVVTTDTPNGIPADSIAPEIGPLAQAFGSVRSANANSPPASNDNFPPAPSRNDSENTTLTAIKSLSVQVSSLESRIAAQDARIALLERSLDDLQRRAGR